MMNDPFRRQPRSQESSCLLPKSLSKNINSKAGTSKARNKNNPGFYQLRILSKPILIITKINQNLIETPQKQFIALASSPLPCLTTSTTPLIIILHQFQNHRLQRQTPPGLLINQIDYFSPYIISTHPAYQQPPSQILFYSNIKQDLPMCQFHQHIHFPPPLTLKYQQLSVKLTPMNYFICPAKKSQGKGGTQQPCQDYL